MTDMMLYILGLFIILVSAVLTQCNVVHNKESKGRRKDIHGLLLSPHDGHGPLISRPRYHGKRMLNKDDIEALYSSRSYRELKKTSNDEVNGEVNGEQYVLVKIPEDEYEANAVDELKEEGKLNDKKQTEIWGRRHRFRFLIKKPKTDEMEEDRRDFSVRERFGKSTVHERFGKREYRDASLSDRFGDGELADTPLPERYGGKRVVSPPRVERFGNIYKEDESENQRWGRFGKKETHDEDNEQRWGRFGKEIREEENKEQRWSGFGREVEVIVVDDNEHDTDSTV